VPRPTAFIIIIIIGVTELRRLGLVRKPAVVVPNHMLEQFAREWLQLCPNGDAATRPDPAGSTNAPA
jgi:N12 class adenine-specific DNA methylase